jgi:hypothetical protein
MREVQVVINTIASTISSTTGILFEKNQSIASLLNFSNSCNPDTSQDFTNILVARREGEIIKQI